MYIILGQSAGDTVPVDQLTFNYEKVEFVKTDPDLGSWSKATGL